DNRCDPHHNPTVKSCLVRVPGTTNSKCIQRVKVIQEWDGHRPKIDNLLRDFRRYLIQKKIDKVLKVKKIRKNKSRFNCDSIKYEGTRIWWIETLLQTPCSDHRKYCIWRILVPYLINVKKYQMKKPLALPKISWIFATKQKD